MNVYSIIIPMSLSFLAACSPIISTNIKQYQPPLKVTENVNVYYLDETPSNHILLGTVRIGESGLTTNCRYEVVIDLAKTEARKAGGNAIKIIHHLKPDIVSTCHRVTAQILKIETAETDSVNKPMEQDNYIATSSTKPQTTDDEDSKSAITVGVLQGGGSLIGLDVELMPGNLFGFQGGIGFKGFGAGLNFHFKPRINSSFMCLGFWHQGWGDTFAQSVFGLTYVFRAKKYFTFQIGGGKLLEVGPEMSKYYKSQGSIPEFILMYSIGVYSPF